MKGYLLLLIVCLASLALVDASRRSGGGSRSSGGTRSSSSRYSSGSSSSRYSSGSRSSRSGGGYFSYGSGGYASRGYSSRSSSSPPYGGYGSSYRGYGSSSISSSGNCNTANYTTKGYGTRWGTNFKNVNKNVDYSNKKVGLGAGPGLIGEARSGPVPTLAVYHRYNKYRDMMYRYRYGSGIGEYEGPYYGHLGLDMTPSYYNDYYLANRCAHPCPSISVCKYGICVCEYGYTQRFGRCSWDWSRDPYQPQRNFDPLSQRCVTNEMCHDYDFNLFCNLNMTATGGRCQCRNDMRWNAEKSECQIYLDVDCSRFTYDSVVNDIIENAVHRTQFRIQNDDQADEVWNMTMSDGWNLTLSREYNLKTSLLEDIVPSDKSLTDDDITEAFCRDVDAFSYEFNDFCHSNDGVSGIMKKDPSIGEYFLEYIDSMNRTQWRYFLPDDTDIDQDGSLSDLEVQHKFNTYIGELFKLIDDDKNNSITEEEFRSLKLDIPQLTKVIDIALENYPLRLFFTAADGNGDSFYDENYFSMPDNRSEIDRGLNKLIGSDFVSTYEKHVLLDTMGMFLFIGDANGDGKLSLEELAMKAKQVTTKILEFLDGNQDGKISLDDFTSLNLPVGSIQNLMTELFGDVTAGQGELELYNMKIAGQNMSRFWGNELKRYDNNGDKKLNAADVFWRLDSREKLTFLIPMLSQKLDKNQDGKIQQEELRQFIDEMFNHVDMDKNGAITLEDAYSFMRESGFDCFQVGALRSFIKVLLDTVDTQTRNFFGYIFKQLDIDGNGQITPQELQKMHVPCDHTSFQMYARHDDNSNYNSDSKVRLSCHQMLPNLFDLDDLLRGFPDLEMDSGRHGGGGGYGGGGRYGRGARYEGGGGYGGYGGGGHHQPRKDTILDKMTNTACEMLY